MIDASEQVGRSRSGLLLLFYAADEALQSVVLQGLSNLGCAVVLHLLISALLLWIGSAMHRGINTKTAALGNSTLGYWLLISCTLGYFGCGLFIITRVDAKGDYFAMNPPSLYAGAAMFGLLAGYVVGMAGYLIQLVVGRFLR